VKEKTKELTTNKYIFCYCAMRFILKNKGKSILDRMATAITEEHSCVTPNCGEKAKLRCPNCVKLGRKFHLIV